MRISFTSQKTREHEQLCINTFKFSQVSCWNKSWSTNINFGQVQMNPTVHDLCHSPSLLTPKQEGTGEESLCRPTSVFVDACIERHVVIRSPAHAAIHLSMQAPQTQIASFSSSQNCLFLVKSDQNFMYLALEYMHGVSEPPSTLGLVLLGLRHLY
jgi:hypothetical protein